MFITIVLIALALFVDYGRFIPNKQQREQNKRAMKEAGDRAREYLETRNRG